MEGSPAAEQGNEQQIPCQYILTFPPGRNGVTLSQLLQLFGPQLSDLGNGEKPGFTKGGSHLKPIGKCQLFPEGGEEAICPGKSA